MMFPKIIKTEEEYEQALDRLDELMDIPEGDTREDELDLLVLLVEKYESERYPIDFPDPIEAIKVRMENMNLSKKDLVPYIGSQSKVSEVLNGKRQLSVNMMRALHEGLGIPAEILLQKSGASLPEKKYNIADFPFTEMFKRGYFSDKYSKLNFAKERFEECLEDFFAFYEELQTEFLYKKSESKFGSENYLKAWQAHILNIAKTESLVTFKKEILTQEFMKELGRLSYYNQGVLLVKEALNKIGIHFLIVEHLPKTYLDGACFYSGEGNPVIVLSLRFNRLDNFWFTLMHELAHLFLGHITSNGHEIIIDDTTKKDDEPTEQETEANKCAYETFIDPERWVKEYKVLSKSESHILELAEELKISPAIIAGRVRWEEGNYQKFSDLIGNKEVKNYFKQ